MTGPLASARQSSQTSGYPDSTKLAASVDLPDPAGPVNAQTPLGVATAVAWSASRPRRFTTSGSTRSIRRCLMVSRLWSLFALQQTYLTPGAVHDKVGNIGKGKYVTALGFARTKPCRASCEPRSQIPSSTEPEALKAAGKTYPHLRSARRQSDRREFGKRNICYDQQPVGLLRKVWDLVLLRSATLRARPENVQLKPPDLSRGRNTAASFPKGRKRP